MTIINFIVYMLEKEHHLLHLKKVLVFYLSSIKNSL